MSKTFLKMAKQEEKSKFVSKDINDFINESQFMNNSPKPKRTQKRQQKNDAVEKEEDISALIGEYEATIAKKKKNCDPANIRQKLFHVMEEQAKARKEGSDNLLKNLSQVLSELEADRNILIDNEKKLEHLVSSMLKCIQQASAATKQKHKALTEIHASFQRQCEKIETNQKEEGEKLADEIEDYMNKMQEKLVTETKRKQLDNLRKTIFLAMQNDL